MVGRLAGEALPCATQFYEVKCPEGFTCISRIRDFGLGHDGAFKYRGASDQFEKVYEEGCPARGKMTPAGQCRRAGADGNHSMCYDMQRYEAGGAAPCGEGTDRCMCVARGPQGRFEFRRQSSHVVDGTQVVMGTHAALPPSRCDDCSRLRSESDCLACKPNCAYQSQMVGGKTITGCFKGHGYDEEFEDSLPGRLYLGGRDKKEVEQRVLDVVPHYRLWDPGEQESPPEDGELEGDQASAAQPTVATPRLPYQSYGEPLSQGLWVKRYKEAAPRIQRLLDKFISQVKNSASLTCADELAGMLEKLRAAQEACRQTQETAQSFVPTGQVLDCHDRDDDLAAAIDDLKEKLTDCKEEAKAEAVVSQGPSSGVSASAALLCGAALSGAMTAPAPYQAAAAQAHGAALCSPAGRCSRRSRRQAAFVAFLDTGR